MFTGTIAVMVTATSRYGIDGVMIPQFDMARYLYSILRNYFFTAYINMHALKMCMLYRKPPALYVKATNV